MVRAALATGAIPGLAGDDALTAIERVARGVSLGGDHGSGSREQQSRRVCESGMHCGGECDVFREVYIEIDVMGRLMVSELHSRQTDMRVGIELGGERMLIAMPSSVELLARQDMQGSNSQSEVR